MKYFQIADSERTEHDDFVLNIQRYMDEGDGATPVYLEEVRVGWIVKPMHE